MRSRLTPEDQTALKLIHQAAELLRRQKTHRIHAELWIGEDGEVHFVCHTQDDDFGATKKAFQQFIDLIQSNLDREQECPFYKADPS